MARLVPGALLALLLLGCRSAPVASGAPSRAPAAVGAPVASPSIAQAVRPADAPRPMRFRLQVGDEVAIDVWRETELSTRQRIQSDGTIAPPLLGALDATGRTLDELRDDLAVRYAEYLKDPKVSVHVTGIHSDRVFVLGEVQDPQAVDLHGPTTLLQAIAMAGGFEQEFANRRAVRVVRRGAGDCPDTLPIDADAIICGRRADVPLQRGDIVYVPSRGVTNWSRSLGQALAPFAVALGSAGAAAAVVSATN
jgi:polysaccharide export outer membrane protein